MKLFSPRNLAVAFALVAFVLSTGAALAAGKQKSVANDSSPSSTFRLAVSTNTTDSGLIRLLEDEQLFQQLHFPESNAISEAKGSGHDR